MKELKLLQIIPALDSGGAEQGTIDVANYIVSKGLKTFVASHGGKMLPLINNQNVYHFKLPIHSKNIITMYRNLKKIKNIIKNHNINLVHVRSRAPAWVLNFIYKKNFRTVSTFHNVYRYQNNIKKFYNKGLSKVDNIVAISKYVKSSIIDIYNIDEEKITVINRGVDTDYFNPIIENQDIYINFLSRYNIPCDKKIILYPARLTSWKGQLEFLNILKLLNINNIICYFIGDDKNKSYLKKLISKISNKKLESYCKVLGGLSKSDVRCMYKCADVIISAPLQPEGLGRIVSEALAMKKIVLGYNFGGVKDQFNGLENLYGITPFDYKEMAEKIKKAFEFSNDTINNLGEISRKHVIEKFSKKLMLKKYYKLYQKNI